MEREGGDGERGEVKREGEREVISKAGVDGEKGR